MPVMSDDALRERAENLARKHLEPMFRDPLVFEAEASESEWDEMICRTTFEQRFAIWRTTSTVEIETDAQGRIVRFSDTARIKAASGVPAVPLSEDMLREVAQTTGLVSAFARILDVAAVSVELREVSFNQYVPNYPASLTVKIDAVRRRVVGLDVTEWDEP